MDGQTGFVMPPVRTLALVLVVVSGFVLATAVTAAVASPGGDAPFSGPSAVLQSSNESDASNATVSTFMQASAADAEHGVESGLFESAYENADADARADVVRDRTDDLEARLAALEAEREELAAADLSPPERRARMVQLSVEIARLERSIERTERRANEAGVDEDRLETLRSNASELAGSEVAAVARGLSGFDDHPGGDQAAGSDSSPGQSGEESPGANDAAGNGSAPGQAAAKGTDGDRGPSEDSTDDRPNGQSANESRNDAGGGPDGPGDSNGANPSDSPGSTGGPPDDARDR